MSKLDRIRITRLEESVHLLTKQIQIEQNYRLMGHTYRVKARATYLGEPISPWVEGILTLKPLVGQPQTAKYSGEIKIPLENCVADGYEMVGPHGTRVTKKYNGSQCFSKRGYYIVSVNWDEVI